MHIWRNKCLEKNDNSSLDKKKGLPAALAATPCIEMEQKKSLFMVTFLKQPSCHLCATLHASSLFTRLGNSRGSREAMAIPEHGYMNSISLSIFQYYSVLFSLHKSSAVLFSLIQLCSVSLSLVKSHSVSLSLVESHSVSFSLSQSP